MMVKPEEENRARRARWLSLCRESVTDLFLPRGYPLSVAPSYMRFSQWQFLHQVTGSTTGVLSMQALLFAVGLGAGAIPVAAALNWVIKDGLGQLGGVLYAGIMSNRFDSDPKRFRFFSGVALQAATTIEVLTPLFPQYFLLLASISNIGKNVSWLAGSATRAQLNRAQALRENLGDVTGKAGSQATAAGLAGTGLGIGISAAVQGSMSGVMLAFVPLSIISLYALYRSNMSVALPHLNEQRLDLLLASMFKEHRHSRKQQLTLVLTLDDNVLPNVLSPTDVAHEETFIRRYRSPYHLSLVVEPSLDRFSRVNAPRTHFPQRMREQSFSRPHAHLLCLVGDALADIRVDDEGKDRPHAQPSLALFFVDNSSALDILRGYYHAYCIRQLVQDNPMLRISGHHFYLVVERTRAFVNSTFDQLCSRLLSKGWSLDHVFLADKERRLRVGRDLDDFNNYF